MLDYVFNVAINGGTMSVKCKRFTRGIDVPCGCHGARRSIWRFQGVYLNPFSTKNDDLFSSEPFPNRAALLRTECHLKLQCYVSFGSAVYRGGNSVIKGKDGRYHAASSRGHFRDKNVPLVSMNEDCWDSKKPSRGFTETLNTN